MKWSQTLVICGVILLAAAAVIFFEHRGMQRLEHRLAGSAAASRALPFEGFANRATPEFSFDEFAELDSLKGGSGSPDLVEEAARPADAEPHVLPPSGKAAPLPVEDELLREIITDELPDASEAERQIWLEELAGLPPTVVRELLRVRQQFRGTPSP